MAINKVVLGNEVLLDLTNDTVTSETLAEGITAHSADGGSIIGTMSTGIEYVETETKIGTFCGKDLYRAILIRNSAITTSTSGQTISTSGLINGTVDIMVNLYGMVHLTGSGLVGWVPINTYHNNNIRSFARWSTSGITCYCSAANNKSIFIMEYTKA